ncbi:hypothetical protein [Synechocystis sp. PCC 7509]|nr:hypothetical protein [Synechocystis sp. PCC 7509]
MNNSTQSQSEDNQFESAVIKVLVQRKMDVLLKETIELLNKTLP